MRRARVNGHFNKVHFISLYALLGKVFASGSKALAIATVGSANLTLFRTSGFESPADS